MSGESRLCAHYSLVFFFYWGLDPQTPLILGDIPQAPLVLLRKYKCVGDAPQRGTALRRALRGRRYVPYIRATAP